MAIKSVKMKCEYCGEDFTKASIKKHLDTCEKNLANADKEKENNFLLQVKDEYLKDYMLILEVKTTAKLKDLDTFLRNIWLECCGHLSMFRINGEEYISSPDKYEDENGMDYTLKNLLYNGITFDYDYDFGSTTSLKLKVLDTVISAKRAKKVKLLARNVEPVTLCASCGQPATMVCSYCMGQEDAFYCDDCCESHECGDEAMLPVCNSPRMGVCGYSG